MMRRWRRTTWAVVMGAVVTGAGFGMVTASVLDDQSTVGDFARAPVGCETTFETERSGTLYVYVETRGRIDDIGDCNNDGRTYDVEFVANVVVRVTDESGGTVEIGSVDQATSYDLPDYSGRAIGRLTLDGGERYRVLVESDALGPVVAIGGRVVPNESPLAIAGAITVMVGGAVVVIALAVAVVTKKRRRRGPWAPPTLNDRASFSA